MTASRLIWPWVVLCCTVRRLRWACYLAIPLALATRIHLLIARKNELGSIVALPCQLDSLALGTHVARSWALISLGAAVWLALCCDIRLLLTFGMSGFAVMSAGLLPAAIYGPASHLFCRRWLRLLGK